MVDMKHKFKHIKWCVNVDIQEKSSVKAETQEGICAFWRECSYIGV